MGRHVAELIDYLHTKKNINYDLVHILGHSLGAHVSGFAGFHTKGGIIGRITGLDPAFLGFQDKTPSERLDSTAAQFVDVIHTSILGMSADIGHIDFYPNRWQFVQPGCSLGVTQNEDCSHARSHIYYMETLQNSLPKYYGYLCTSYSDLNGGKCMKNPTEFGENTPHSARGTYYFKTNSEKPFGLGNYEYNNKNIEY